MKVSRDLPFYALVILLGVMLVMSSVFADEYRELEEYIKGDSVVKEISDREPPGEKGEQLRGMVDRQRQAGTSIVFDDPKQWVIIQEGDLKVTSRPDHSLPLFGNDYVAVTFKNEQEGGSLKLLLKDAITVQEPFNSIDVWVYGDYFEWHGYYTGIHKPLFDVFVLLEDVSGEIHEINMGKVRWDFWGILTQKIEDETGINHTASGGDGNWNLDYPVKFRGLHIPKIPKGDYRRLMFDSVTFFYDSMDIPEVEFRIADLSFPTTENTILPTFERECHISVEEVTRKRALFLTDKGVSLSSTDGVDEIIYTYFPKSGGLSDLEVTANGHTFKPANNGDLTFVFDGAIYNASAVDCKLQDMTLGDDYVYTEWKASKGKDSVTYTMRMTLKGKSLVIDFESNQGKVGGLDLGTITGLDGAKGLVVPYITMGFDKKVGIAYGKNLFVSSFLDWYTTNASTFYGGLEQGSSVRINGGATYRALTDGSRNPMKERAFLTVSSDFEEVLPSIPNPPAVSLEISKRYMHAHWMNSSVGRFNIYTSLMEKYKLLGVDYAAITIHEDMWSSGSKSPSTAQGPEDFTMTAEVAMDIIGGDEAVIAWAERGKELGYYVGPYSNYTDCSPAGEAWKLEYITREPDSQFKRSWAPCFNMMPIKAVDMQDYYSRKQVEKFGFNTDYNDVHTCVPPWQYVDYQAGVPGAGMLATTFYSYGRLLRNDQEVFGGPVISEGGHHWMYAGLVGGSYGHMTVEGGNIIGELPLLVNFDLRKMHPLQADVAVAYNELLDGDRYKGLAWTIAYGHAGYLPADHSGIWTSQYYHLLEELQFRYVGVPVQDIRYGTRNGLLVDTNEAIVNGHLQNNYVYVKYENGLEVYVNGNQSLQWKVELGGKTYVLGKNSWAAKLGDEFVTYSTENDGTRQSFVYSPEYIYADGGGKRTDFGPIVTASSVAVKLGSSNKIRIIALEQNDSGVLLRNLVNKRAIVKVYAMNQELVTAKEISPSDSEVNLEFVANGVIYEIEW